MKDERKTFADARWLHGLCLFALLLRPICSLAQTNNEATGKDEAPKEVHWSFRPVVRPSIPPVPNPKWKVQNPVDNFIFARLAREGLSPSSDATRRVLIRRLYFDLIGLPPSPEQVRAFEADSSKDAYEKVVESLLASPQYGERWAQHWLDVARFAESNGFEMNQPRPNAWRYRDYVIEAFNQDKPFDRFIKEQFAGDVFDADAATGFLVAGPWDQVKSPDPVLTESQRADELHDMVSTASTAFLGLTVGCARCHNHKFDPIPQVDYYALKSCLAGVSHGDRRLHTTESEAKEKEAEDLKHQLTKIDSDLGRFDPLVSTRRILLIEPEPGFGSHLVQQLKPARRVSYKSGTGRGELNDPGTLDRLPTITKHCLTWTNSPDSDVLVYEPGAEGRFQLRVSWGCGSNDEAKDAVYLLDKDGDLTTTDDQTTLARMDQRRFADGVEAVTNHLVWSGFHDVGVWNLSASNKIILRTGTNKVVVSAGLLALVEQAPQSENVTPTRGSGGGDLPQAGTDIPAAPEPVVPRTTAQFLRTQVNARRNLESFAPVRARRLRFTVNKTTDAEPCLDELEVFTAGSNPKNIALVSAGTKVTASSVFPNSEIHRIEHINDGKYGNSRSWISNERGKGWIELEFADEALINRVIWGRDREQQFTDRLAVDYRIEVALGSNDWQVIASSQDRIPYSSGRTSAPTLILTGLSPKDTQGARSLLKERDQLQSRVQKLTDFPMAYAGVMTNKIDETYRLLRGDPMQKREVIQPGVLQAISLQIPSGQDTYGKKWSSLTENQQRRLSLADWIASPSNPLAARVMVNRLWQHHFGEGIVSTPSDFGRKGATPSHPELLGWLASEFLNPTTRATAQEPAVVPGSIKHIHRLIVTSAAYRQSSISRPECIAVDAGSRLLWRYPPQRLEAETLRDTILAISGKLDLKMGGPGFSAFEANDNYVRIYNPKKTYAPEDWRRMIYMTKVRMQQDSTFGAFDCPDGGQIAPKRMRSTTPLQALNLLNSPFLVQQTGFFAERLEHDVQGDVAAEIRRAFELGYGRAPDTQEARAAKEFVDKNGLPLFCRAIFNSNELLFVY